MIGAGTGLLLLIALAFILPDQWLQAKPVVLLATDLLAISASAAAIFYGTREIRRYGGSFGQGLRYFLAGIAIMGSYELLDMLQRLEMSPFNVLFESVGRARTENIFATTAMLLFFYGVWKMRGE